MFSGCYTSFEGVLPGTGSGSNSDSDFLPKVYLAGNILDNDPYMDSQLYWYQDSRPALWNNSEITYLEIDPYENGEAKIIYNNGTDIYIGGYLYNESVGDNTDSRACYWKNNVLAMLVSDTRSSVTTITGYGSTVYFGGFDRFDNGTPGDETDDRDIACYWKLEGTTITKFNVRAADSQYNYSKITAITQDDNYIYFTVNSDANAYYYRYNKNNDTEVNNVNLIRDADYSVPPYKATGISVSNGFAYISGTFSDWPRALYWKVAVDATATEHYTHKDLPRDWNASGANDIVVDGNILYITGWDNLIHYQNACYWKQIIGEQEGLRRVVFETEYESEALKLYKSGNTVYMSGFIINKDDESRVTPCLWKDRSRYRLSIDPDGDHAFTSTVTVIP